MAALVLLAYPPTAVQADPVATIVRGVEPDGSERLAEDLALLWRESFAFDGSWLAVRQQPDPRARLRALRQDRAAFAVLDAASYAALRDEFPEVAVLSALNPLPVHLLRRGAEPGPLRKAPGTIVFTAHARFLAETLAEQAAAAGSAPAVLRLTDPPGAIELLRRGPPPDSLVLLAAPLGTREIAAVLRGDPALHLQGLAGDVLDAVRRDRPWIFPATIVRGTYPEQAERVEVPAVYLLLLTLAQLPQDDARRMLDCLYGRREQVAPFDPVFALVERRANADVAKWAPFHATAAKELGVAP